MAELTRVADVAYEALQVTVLHLRRIAGVVSSAAVRVTHEVEDLVWDYQDVAGDLRRSARPRDLGPVDPRAPEEPPA
jgi:hypothetical protein